MNEITIKGTDFVCKTKSFVFPGGEIQVALEDFPGAMMSGNLKIWTKIQSAQDVMQLVMLKEILDRLHRQDAYVGRRDLILRYFPYARQDRVMSQNEAFSLKAFANLINFLGFDQVDICDPHSDVTPALINNVRVLSQLDCMKTHGALENLLKGDLVPVLIAPDAGAMKKIFPIAQHYKLDYTTASKLRNTTTGEITETQLNNPMMVKNRNVLMVDDICDGGRTFLELAKVLKSAGAEKIFLYVTHGIFSKGLSVFSGYVDGIYTTGSYDRVIPVDEHYVGDFYKSDF